MATSARLASTPPAPVRTTERRPAPRACLTARTTLGELPLVLIPTKTSPGRPRACTCRSNTPSNPQSLAKAVRKEVSVVSAMAGSPGRSKLFVNRLTNSVAMCWQSAALPPFPQSSTLPPPRNAWATRSAAATMASSHASALRRLVSALSRRYARTVSRPSVNIHASPSDSRGLCRSCWRYDVLVWTRYGVDLSADAEATHRLKRNERLGTPYVWSSSVPPFGGNGD